MSEAIQSFRLRVLCGFCGQAELTLWEKQKSVEVRRTVSLTIDMQLVKWHIRLSSTLLSTTLHCNKLWDRYLARCLFWRQARAPLRICCSDRSAARDRGRP